MPTAEGERLSPDDLRTAALRWITGRRSWVVEDPPPDSLPDPELVAQLRSFVAHLTWLADEFAARAQS